MTAQENWYENFLDAGIGEALVCRDALRLSRQLGLQRDHLETDCLELC